MDKSNFVKDGMKKLPPGFRFQPTDEELVFQYLKSKVLSWSLPTSVIPEANIYKYDPWDLPGDLEQERYFFSNNEAKYPNGNRVNRATASGHWKATGIDKQIVSSTNNFNSHNNIVGMKKTLVFYRGKPPHGSRTDWIMHEYRLVSLSNPEPSQPKHPPTQSCIYNNKVGEWVLCRIFLKKRSTTDNYDSQITESTCKNNEGHKVVKYFDFMKSDQEENALECATAWSSSSTSLCSNSSSITEVCSKIDIGED